MKKEPSEPEDPGPTYHQDLNLHKETVKMDNNHVYKWTVASSGTVPLKVEGGTVNSTTESKKITVVYPSIAGIRYPTLQKARSLSSAERAYSETMKIDPSQNSDQDPEHSNREDGGRSNIEDMKRLSPVVENENSYKNSTTESKKITVVYSSIAGIRYPTLKKARSLPIADRAYSETMKIVPSQNSDQDPEHSNREDGGRSNIEDMKQVSPGVANRNSYKDGASEHSKRAVETNRTETEAAGRVSTKVQQKVSNKETSGSGKVLVTILNRTKQSNSVVKSKLEIERMVKKALTALKYKNLKEDLKNNFFLYNCTLLKSNENCIEYLKFYHGEATTIQLSVKIRSDFTPLIEVHGKHVSPEHEFWSGLPEKCTTLADIVKLLTKLHGFKVCMGNPDKEYHSLIKSHVEWCQPPQAYVEGDFGAVKDGVSYTSSIRTMACELLTKYKRCRKCILYRNTLKKAKTRERKDKQNIPSDLLTSKKPHSKMNSQELIAKLQQALKQAKTFAVENEQLRQHMTRTFDVLKWSGASTIATTLMTGGELNMGTYLSTSESGHVPQLNDFTIVTEANDQDTPAHREEGSKVGTTIMVVPTEVSTNKDFQAEIGSHGGEPHEGLVLKAMNGGTKMRENDADFTKNHVLERTALKSPQNLANSLASQIGVNHENEKAIQSSETTEVCDDSHPVAAPKNPHPDLECGPPSPVLHSESPQNTDMHDCKECGRAFSRVQDLKNHARTHYAKKTFKCWRCRKIFPSLSILVAHRKVHTVTKHVKCDKCGKVFSNAIQLRSHAIKEHWDDHQFKCDKCDKVFSQYPSLALHRRTHKVEKPFKCCICNRAYATINFLTAHMKTHTGERPYKCTQCSKAYSSSESLKSHMRFHTGENSCKCKLCGKAYSSSTLRAHMRVHSGEKPYECEYCDKRFHIASRLTYHRKTHTGEKPYKCDICSKTFSRLASVKIHRVIHTGDKPYKCKLCNKAFTSSCNLTRHQRIHSGEKPYQCDLCGKSFGRSAHLEAHLMVHNGEKSFKCEICEKEFTHASYYKSHMRIHTGERPYQCQECGKTFIHKGNLNRHMTMHTEEKPFQCNLCEKAFRFKISLKQHAVTHSGEKPHTCEQCGLAFALKSNLVRHQRTHTGEKPFQCEQCGKAFTQSTHLIAHIKTHKSRSNNAGSRTKAD